MKQYWFRNRKSLTILSLMLFLVAVVACGTAEPDATSDSASQPTAQEQPPAAGSTTLAPGDKAEPTQASAQKSEPARAPAAVPGAAPTSVPERVAVPETGTTADATGILRIANKDLGPPQFLPKNMAVPQATYVSPVIFDALWDMNPNGELQNDLLEEWSLSPDGTLWTLKLKKGIPFHKGWGDVTVHDLVWVVEQMQEEESRHPSKTHMRRFFDRDSSRFNIIDDYTVEMSTGDLVAYDFTWRFRQFGANNFILLASKKYAESVGEEQATLEGIGTGPWQFVEFRTNERFISEAVEDHWDKTPYFKELHYFQIAEEATRIANFRAGELDTMQMSLSSIPAL